MFAGPGFTGWPTAAGNGWIAFRGQVTGGNSTETIVVDQGNTTKTDYCGTSSFTATDPLARIENTNMDSYNFTWSAAATCNVAPNEDGFKVFVNVTFTGVPLASVVSPENCQLSSRPRTNALFHRALALGRSQV